MSNNFQFNIKYPHNTETIEEVLEYDTLVPFVDENNIITHYYDPSNNTIKNSATKEITNQVFLGPTEFEDEKEIIIDQDSITVKHLNNMLEDNIDPLFKQVDLQLNPNMDIPAQAPAPAPAPVNNEEYNKKILLSVFGLIFLFALIFLIYKGCESGWLEKAKEQINKGISKLVKRGRK